MFKKILIANRGEIAIRIMATCREMGIATVAVYSQADRAARHVREADEAYEIGPAPATQSYLRSEKIIEVARQSGAEAIHPGYGFLSENTAFVEACEAAGIVFIGPPAAAMRLMGSKIAAKQLAQAVEAPTIPGYNGESQDNTLLLHEARQIGFPLLIKAASGGGGKGMREVHAEKHFLTELAGARREALASFGDATVFLEKLILHPRHIEIQILGDCYGNIIHLGERECSIQRRHQKIIEESPSVALTPALRTEMGAAAVRIAQAAKYINAGTLEFMLDRDQRFYFLEMNTRLQVEHPVTELVTGLDLVRHQLLIAAGEPLGIKQEEISPRGHAIEVRLYAEDPAQNFLPSTGIVSQFNVPIGPGIRVDSGIASGDEITQFYDPMLAKLIVYGENRPAAIARLQSALTRTVVLGVTTNISLLQTIATHPTYREGQTYTSFLDEHNILEVGAETGNLDNLKYALHAAALSELTRREMSEPTQREMSEPTRREQMAQEGGKLPLYTQGKLEASSSHPPSPINQPKGLVAKARLWLPFDVETELASVSPATEKLTRKVLELASVSPTTSGMGKTRNPWQTLGSWRTIGEDRYVIYEYKNQRYKVTVAPAQAGSWQVRIDDQPAQIITYTANPENLVLLRYAHKLVRASVLRQPDAILVSIQGQIFRLGRQQPPSVERAARTSTSDHAQAALTAPMAGTIVKVQVSEDQKVEPRQVLLILTAMKMEHTITAPRAGKVRRVHYKEGDVVKGGAVLIEIE
jgi:3-methylcrotonyl-CoA carboxylase alpha subunit